MSEIEWLLKWFNDRNPEKKISINTNYIDDDLIDSFGIIELIEEIEKNFNIKINETIFEDNSVFTINGLANIINSRCVSNK